MQRTERGIMLPIAGCLVWAVTVLVAAAAEAIKWYVNHH
jgi:hypothetical protein